MSRKTTDGVPEAALEALLREGVRSLGGMLEKQAPTRWGIPDRVVFLPFGIIYFVELKTDVGKLRPTQEVWHQRALSLGAPVTTISGKAELVAWLREQRLLIRRAHDAVHLAGDRAAHPNDPRRGVMSSRPYRVERSEGDAWKVVSTKKDRGEALARARHLQDVTGAPHRVTYRGGTIVE